MIRVPLGIDRVSRVQDAADGDTVKVRIEIMPPSAPIPESLGKVGSYAVALDDAEQTAMRVRSVAVLSSGPAVVLDIERPAGIKSGRFTIRIEGLVPGLDVAVAPWGVRSTATDPGDVRPPASAAPAAPSVPNYLYRDYPSFKQLMIDALQRALPRAREVHEADGGIAVIDVLAYAADHLAYYQDAVATEAYLATARRRVSVRRHVRLLDYQLYEGCTPRVWIHVCPEAPMTFAKRHRFTTHSEGAGDRRVFETLAEGHVSPLLCNMSLWSFEGAETVLPAGRTTAVLDAPQGAVLKAGDVLVFEQRVDPLSGAASSPLHRQAVRLCADGIVFASPGEANRCLVQISWYPDDALVQSFDLRHDAQGKPATHVHANMLPADFGEFIDDPKWYEIDDHGIVRALIPDLTFAVDYAPGDRGVASEAQDIKPYNAVPQISANSYPYGIARTWTARRDLIGADPFERVFTVEIERNGSINLRFGDGKNGSQPVPRSRFRLAYRRGIGPDGHIGPDAIDFDAILGGVRYRARNPLASFGGAERQDADEARRDAPQLVRKARVRRCISDEDFVRCARDVAGVRAATVRRRWTGNGSTVQVYIDGDGALEALCERVAAALDRARVIGTDINVRGPRLVGVIAKLEITLAAGASENDVLRRVSAAIAVAIETEKLTLGSTVYASWFIAAAIRTAGVAQVDLRAFSRFRGPDARSEGFILFDATEKPALVDDSGLATAGRPILAVCP